MYINKLKIENFKNIKSREFKFNKINLLNGSNGSGKSSILESITYLLTNYLDEKIEDHIRWGQKEFKLYINLSDYFDNNIDYKIKYNKVTKRELIINNNIEDPYLQSDAIDYLRTQINSNVALYSNISIQGKSTQLLFEKPVPRLEKLKLLFGINELDKPIEKIKEDINNLKEEVKNINLELNLLRDKKFNYVDEYKLDDFSLIKNEVDLLIIKKEKYEIKIKIYNDYLFQLEEYYKKVKEKKQLEDNLRISNEVLNNINKKKYKDIINLNYDDVIKKYNELKSEYILFKKNKELKNNLEKQISEKNNKLSSLKERLDNIILSRIKKPEKTKDDIEKLIKDKENIQKEFFKLENKYNAIINNECYMCGAEFSNNDINETYNLLEKYKIDLKNIEDIINDNNDIISIYDKKIQENELKLNEKNSINEMIENINEEKILYENQFNSLDNFDEKKEYENNINLLNEQINLINEYKEEIKKINEEINTIKIRLENFDNLILPEEIKYPGEFDDIYFEKLKKELYIYIEKENNLKKIKKINLKTKKEENENNKIIKEKEEILNKNRNKIILLESAKKILSKDFSSFLIDKGTNFIKSKMNELFSKSYGKYYITLNRDSKGIDFYYSSFENNILTPVGLASGYEKQLLSVSFRMALANLHKFGIFIFDEIDSDSMEDNSLKLFKIILTQNYKQLFIATHKENTKEYLQSLQECSVFEF